VRLLAGTGVAVIGHARAAAASAEFAGNLEVAASLLEIAEAGERLWAAGWVSAKR
jgi:hypothetical protein